VYWCVEYFETNPKILGPLLFVLLNVAVLIERVPFAVFRNRLQLAPEVAEKRELLARYFQLVRDEATVEVGPSTIPGVERHKSTSSAQRLVHKL